jgi:hypothetical protein
MPIICQVPLIETGPNAFEVFPPASTTSTIGISRCPKIATAYYRCLIYNHQGKSVPNQKKPPGQYWLGGVFHGTGREYPNIFTNRMCHTSTEI